MLFFFKKGKKDTSGTTDKILEWDYECSNRHVTTNSSQYGFVTNKSCYTNVIFFIRITSLVDLEIIAMILDLSKAFNNSKIRLEETIVRWIYNWQNDCIIGKKYQADATGLCPKLCLFNIFIECLGWENWFIKLADDTKLGE